MTYKARRFVAKEVTALGAVQAKIYTIMAEGREDPDVATALDFAQQYLLSSTAHNVEETGAGYLILHAGETLDWLLVRWWVDGGIVAGLLASRDGDSHFELCTLPYVECVWEGIVTEFERGAWVRHMMSEVPDKLAYLEDRLPSGFY